MASYGGPRTCTPSEFHLALLRPVILQILRAQGYYASTAGTIDCLTELAGQYLYAVAKRTAEHATLNNRLGPPGTPGLVDVRRALEECGALCPGTSPGEPPPAKRRRLSSSGGAGGDGHDDHGHDDHDDDHDEDDEDDEEAEDTAGVDEFISWAMGRKNQRIRKVAGVVAPVGAIEAGAEGEDGMVEEERPSDYLDALKRKHNKTDQDSKYAGTVLGRSIDHGEILIEGGPDTSLAAWAARMREASLRPPDPRRADDDDDDDGNGGNGNSPRPPSSGLSSLADEEVEMMNFG